MLFKHKHLLEELRKNGRAARGEILSMKTVGQSGSLRAAWAPDEDLSATWTDCWMKLRVVPQDRADAPFEASVYTRMHTFAFQGSHVPVWYDPADHARVAVDYEAALENANRAFAEADTLERHSDLLKHRYDQRLAMAWAPHADDLIPLDVVASPGHGRVTVTDTLQRLVADAVAHEAVAAVRASIPALSLALDAAWFDRNDLRFSQTYGEPSPRGGVQPAAAPDTGADLQFALAAALVSLLGGHMVRTDVALTGRLTAAGEPLAVADLGHKAAAAARGYAKRLVAPAGNEPDVHRIPEGKRKGLDFVCAATLADAMRAALAKRAVEGFIPPS
jgi:hypothetical protein